MAQSELPRVGGIEGMEETFDISQREEVAEAPQARGRAWAGCCS